jgi:hypothetical protein
MGPPETSYLGSSLATRGLRDVRYRTANGTKLASKKSAPRRNDAPIGPSNLLKPSHRPISTYPAPTSQRNSAEGESKLPSYYPQSFREPRLDLAPERGEALSNHGHARSGRADRIMQKRKNPSQSFHVTVLASLVQ